MKLLKNNVDYRLRFWAMIRPEICLNYGHTWARIWQGEGSLLPLVQLWSKTPNQLKEHIK